ncbi:MAG: DUF1559 domain-containing protein [Planctomycetia bacterium]|nr:DUF1559 domain-containing protein [Planctomycetia bacterium]
MAYVLFGPMELLVLMLSGGGLPLGVPPLPEDKLIVSAAPEECLFYMSSYGTADADPASKNAAERLLAEPEVQHFLTTLWKAVGQTAGQSGGRDAEMFAKFVLPLAETALTRPFGVHVTKVNITPFGGDVEAGLVLNAGDKAEPLRETLMQLETMLLAELPGGAVSENAIGKAKMRVLPMPPGAPQVQWGFRGEYLIIAVGADSANKMLEGMDSARGPPAWLKDVHKRLPVARPSTVQYINVEGALAAMAAAGPIFGEAAGPLEALGVTKIKHVASVTGLAETDMVTLTQIVTDGEPAGVLALFPDKPLTATDLAPIPADATWAFAMKMDAGKTWQQLVQMLGAAEPRAREELEEGLRNAERELNVSVVRDVLAPLGDVWCVYNSPSDGLLFTGATAVVKVRDRKRLEETNQKLLELLAREFAAVEGPIPLPAGDVVPFNNFGPQLPQGIPARAAQRQQVNPLRQFSFKEHTVYYCDIGSEGAPLAPSWCITDDALVIALYPQAVKAYLSRDPKRPSLASLPAVAEQLKRSPAIYSYCNTQELVGLVYPVVTAAAPVMLSQLRREGFDMELSALPSQGAIQKHAKPSWTACRRVADGIMLECHQSVPGGGVVAGLIAPAAMFVAKRSRHGDVAAMIGIPAAAAPEDKGEGANLKEIGLAMHTYHDARGQLPEPASLDKNNKALLSWRVHLLPYLGEEELYRQFKLNEPWDSDHNKKLVAKIPKVFQCGGVKAEEGKTRILVPVGSAAIFASDRGTKLSDITDGTSRTIMALLVAPEAAVVWTRPDDWKFDVDDQRTSMAGYKEQTKFKALFADGSVKTIDPSQQGIDFVKALFTRSGSENQFNYEFPQER